MITTNKLKILCLCKGGLVRSVALKKFIVTNYDDTDVLAAGGLTVQMDETRAMLIQWAGVVFVLSGSALKKLRKQYPLYKNRFVEVPVGSDVWGDASHPALIKTIENFHHVIDGAIKDLREYVRMFGNQER